MDVNQRRSTLPTVKADNKTTWSGTAKVNLLLPITRPGNLEWEGADYNCWVPGVGSQRGKPFAHDDLLSQHNNSSSRKAESQ